MKKMIVSLFAVALVVALATSAMAAFTEKDPNGKSVVVADGITLLGDNVKGTKIFTFSFAENCAVGTLSVKQGANGAVTTFEIPDDCVPAFEFKTGANLFYEFEIDLCATYGHDYYWILFAEATCTEAEQWKLICRRDCGFESGYTNPRGEPLGHDWVLTTSDFVEPTCTLEGYTYDYYVCDRCGEVGEWRGNYVYTDALGHDFESIIWDGWGWYASGCSRCDWAGYLSYDHCFYGHSTDLNSCQDECEWCGEVGRCLEFCEVCGECLACGDCPGHGLTVEQWIAAITDAINDAGGIIADLVDSTDRYSITLTINGEDYKFTGGNSATADKSCVIDGVTYIINVRGNGTWVVIRG